MAKITKKQQTAISKVIYRWAETLSGTRAPDMEKVRKIFNHVYPLRKGCFSVALEKPTNRRKTRRVWAPLKAPRFVLVKSPMAFKIAQAVIRGYVSKKAAKEACKAFGIADDFLVELRRDKTVEIFKTARSSFGWYATQISRVWEGMLLNDTRAAAWAAFNDGDDASGSLHEEHAEKYAQWRALLPSKHELFRNEGLYALDNNDLLKICLPTGRVRRGWGNSSNILSFGNFFCNEPSCNGVNRVFFAPWSYSCGTSTRSRMTELELRATWNSTMLDAEILFTLLGVNDVEQTGAVELLHEIPLFMTFQTQVLICAERPVIKRHAANELHCDDGPAVSWPDGAGQYYLDGHALGRLGYKIITAPEQLTSDDIRAENNEEVKRVAIERFGWGRYLAGIGARVLDRRENWVDNTIEAVIRITEQRDQYNWTTKRDEPVEIPQHKMILSCRSTARQYFLAIPDDIHTCEGGQRWMAEGGNTQYVTALSCPARLIGAS